MTSVVIHTLYSTSRKLFLKKIQSIDGGRTLFIGQDTINEFKEFEINDKSIYFDK